MKQLSELNKISKRVEKIKGEIQQLILNLPDNPNINRIPNSNSFTMSISQILGNKNNPTARMDVFFHDYLAQYKYISTVISKARPEKVVRLLQRIVSEGKHKDKADYRTFNPSVINHIKNLLEA